MSVHYKVKGKPKPEIPHNGYCLLLHYSNSQYEPRVFGPFSVPAQAIEKAQTDLGLVFHPLDAPRLKRPTISKRYAIVNTEKIPQDDWIAYVTVETLEKTVLQRGRLPAPQKRIEPKHDGDYHGGRFN